MGLYSMPRYFQNMPEIGKELRSVNAENAADSTERRTALSIRLKSHWLAQ